VVAKVRGWRSALDRMVALAHDRARGAVVQMAVAHTDAVEEAEKLLQLVRSRLNCSDIFVAEAGPALAAHAGAGAVGIAMLAEDTQPR
jgi:fatty acid-binding protein DegV